MEHIRLEFSFEILHKRGEEQQHDGTRQTDFTEKARDSIFNPTQFLQTTQGPQDTHRSQAEENVHHNVRDRVQRAIHTIIFPERRDRRYEDADIHNR